MAVKKKKKAAKKPAKKAGPARNVRAAANTVVREAVRRKKQPGRVFVVAGPSGVGKTTLCKKALEALQGRLHWSISHTTRPQREGEVDGRDYHFVSAEKFRRFRKSKLYVPAGFIVFHPIFDGSVSAHGP